jgi:hypothetical protein
MEGLIAIGYEEPEYPTERGRISHMYFPKNEGLYVGSLIYATASPPDVYKIHGTINNERDFLFSKGKVSLTQGCIGTKINTTLQS